MSRHTKAELTAAENKTERQWPLSDVPSQEQRPPGVLILRRSKYHLEFFPVSVTDSFRAE